jgi:hypothetical protein
MQRTKGRGKSSLEAERWSEPRISDKRRSPPGGAKGPANSAGGRRVWCCVPCLARLCGTSMRLRDRLSRAKCQGVWRPMSNRRFDAEHTDDVCSLGNCGPIRQRKSNTCLSRKAGPSMAHENPQDAVWGRENPSANIRGHSRCDVGFKGLELGKTQVGRPPRGWVAWRHGAGFSQSDRTSPISWHRSGRLSAAWPASHLHRVPSSRPGSRAILFVLRLLLGPTPRCGMPRDSHLDRPAFQRGDSPSSSVAEHFDRRDGPRSGFVVTGRIPARTRPFPCSLPLIRATLRRGRFVPFPGPRGCAPRCWMSGHRARCRTMDTQSVVVAAN